VSRPHSPLSARMAALAPLVVRIIVGVIMFAHGLMKLERGPAMFGQGLAEMGVPGPAFMAYVVTFTELVGGALLVLGLLSRFAALALTIDLIVAILLVKLEVGLIAPRGSGGSGAELDLALIAGFLAILLAGPGPIALDRVLGLERSARGAIPRPAS
jgi:putative oxidoreductase